MSQHSWEMIAKGVSAVWPLLIGLIGIYIGATLSTRNQKRQWIADNKKEECRELLTAMTKVADLALEARAQKDSGGAEVLALQATWAEERKCLIILQDRIFIAEKLRAKKVSALWRALATDFIANGDAKKFGEKLNEIKAIIIDIALNE
jgi:hypothetical protein